MAQFRKAQFGMDAIEGIYEGYTNGDTWNGWACPSFEYSEAERVLNASRINGFLWSYDNAKDKFIVWNKTEHPDKNAPEVFEAKEIDVEGHLIRVYPVGAYAWIWEELL